MQLTDHFSLAELTTTQVRRFVAQQANPPADVIEALRHTAGRLELVRAALEHRPMTITSGWRCAGLNKAVGGAKASAHITGYAADFICPAFGSPLAIATAIVDAGLIFDQLIEEGTWVHISFAPALRQQVLSAGHNGALRAGLRGHDWT